MTTIDEPTTHSHGGGGVPVAGPTRRDAPDQPRGDDGESPSAAPAADILGR